MTATPDSQVRDARVHCRPVRASIGGSVHAAANQSGIETERIGRVDDHRPTARVPSRDHSLTNAISRSRTIAKILPRGYADCVPRKELPRTSWSSAVSRGARAGKAAAAMTPEARIERAKKASRVMTPEERIARAQKASAAVAGRKAKKRPA